MVVDYLSSSPTGLDIRCPPNRGQVPVPAAVRVVCARVAARAVSRGLSSAPVGAESQSFTAGPFSTNQSFGSNSNAGGVFLTAEDKRMLRSVRGGRRGAFTVSLY